MSGEHDRHDDTGEGLLERIQTAATRAKDARDRADLAQRQRDELIVRAVDSGIPQRRVAAAAGVAKSRIVGILGSIGFGEYV